MSFSSGAVDACEYRPVPPARLIVVEGSVVPCETAQLRPKTTRPFLTVFISYLGEWA
jgi:hypothetical protein